MQVDRKHLKRYAVAISEPAKRKLSGFEVPGDFVVGTDDGFGTQLDVIYIDRNDEEAETYDDALRSTFVIPKRGTDPVGQYGYLFTGLVITDDLRTWYRENFKVKELPTSAD